MDGTITTIYCLCDDFLKATRRFDDPQVRLSTDEVMTVPLVAATFFGANIDKTRRFNHRLHAIDSDLCQELFSLLAEFFERNNSERTYAADALPVAACDNVRIRRCRRLLRE